MPGERITHLLLAGLLLAPAAVVPVAVAGWDCHQDQESGGWVCTGLPDAPETPATAGPQSTATDPSLLPQPPAPVVSGAPAAPATETASPAAPTRKAPAPRHEPPPSRQPDQRVEKAVEPVSEKTTAKVSKPTPATAEGPKPSVESDEQLPTKAEFEAEEEPAAIQAREPEAAAPQPAVTESEESPPAAEGGEEILAEAGASAAPTIPEAEPADLDYNRLEEGLTWDYCGAPPGGRPFDAGPLPDPTEPIEISADGAELFRLEDRALLTGDVEVRRGTQLLEAEQVSYHRGSGMAQASGGVLYRQPGLRLLGQQAQMNLIERRGSVDHALYRFSGTNARGSSDHAEIESPTQARFDNITYTACPPGSDAWELQADELEIDQAEGRGVARHAKVRVAGIPILYSPYLSFPLDDRRKSGFLAPSLGNSDTLGIDLSTPYYLNLAPNMDATLIPSYLSKRGVMLGGEFRFLTSQERGKFFGEVIPDDREYDGGARGGVSFEQQGQFGPRWATDVNFDWVSDDTFLEDFGRNLSVTSTRNLEQRGDLYYFSNHWLALARLQHFQTVDPSITPENKPYSRLPQLLYIYDRLGLWQGTDFHLEAEDAYFDHDSKVHGNRLAFRPIVSLPLQLPYGHLIPKAMLNYVTYWLQDQEPGLSDTPSLTVPTFSLDGGLVFERGLDWLDRSATLTLEPRLFYLYTPYKDQNELPVFDSAELDFSFASLFRENRFTGRDRVGDANQLTVALTSRAFDNSDGREVFRGSIGQVLFFDDRRVQLQGGTEEDNRSALAAELAARLGGDWSSRGSLFWDPNKGDDQILNASAGIYYHGPERRLLNLTYRLNRDEQNNDTSFEDTDLSFMWPVNPRLQLVGRWLYSLRNDRTMEAFAGVQYGECCWKVRAVVRNFVYSAEEDSNFSFMLQVELASLGAFGSDIEEFLEREVYGYEME